MTILGLGLLVTIVRPQRRVVILGGLSLSERLQSVRLVASARLERAEEWSGNQVRRTSSWLLGR